ncbi:SMI1/KNR4 family protein [Streptomyces sp. JV185]|uniref:SMI1/KNR4 family protein n=1 Tax=Streptomyces sp. JV185 TaxID=858638 RepID=UPI002E79CEA6|nr:SMI1/KNR4 family protein [Streptomyces sp. JV185]MEE1770573.1 SMI1/KNR4 family protein [Streptomyces sp. JV185]
MPATENDEPTPDPRSAAHPWRDLLQRWSDEWLDPVLHEQERHEPFPDGIRAARWLGGPGATPGELAGLEERLGVRLPPSYREFLRTSNGWLDTTTWIRRLLPTREVGWARDLDPELIEGPTTDGQPYDIPDEEYFVHGAEQQSWAIRTEYLSSMLKISHTPGAGDVYLLNPRIVTPDGEWEAWYLAHWLPGAVRYRSFWDLMNDEYRTFRDDWK